MSSDTAPVPRETGFALLVAYGLFLAAPFNGLTAIAGAILVYLKRAEARGTLWQSHVRNLLLVFWIGVAVLALMLAVAVEAFGGLIFSLVATDGHPPPALVGSLAIIAPALGIAGLLFAIWYLYRVLRGLIRALDGEPY